MIFLAYLERDCIVHTTACMEHQQSALLTPALLKTCLQMCSLEGQKIIWLMGMQGETDSNGGPAEDVEKQWLKKTSSALKRKLALLLLQLPIERVQQIL